MSLFSLLTEPEETKSSTELLGEGSSKSHIKPRDDSVGSSLEGDPETEDNTAFPQITPLQAVIIIGPPGVYADECSMICAEFAFSHVSISNAPDDEDPDFLRSLSVTSAVACRSVFAQITRYFPFCQTMRKLRTAGTWMESRHKLSIDPSGWLLSRVFPLMFELLNTFP